MGKGNVDPLQNPYPITDCQIVTCDYWVAPTPVPNLVQIHPQGLLRKSVKYNDNLIN